MLITGKRTIKDGMLSTPEIMVTQKLVIQKIQIHIAICHVVSLIHALGVVGRVV